jgi:predicted SprT family Zn-dependent metalloprotease
MGEAVKQPVENLRKEDRETGAISPADLATNVGTGLWNLAGVLIGEPVGETVHQATETTGIAGTNRLLGELAGKLPGADPEQTKFVADQVNNFIELVGQTVIAPETLEAKAAKGPTYIESLGAEKAAADRRVAKPRVRLVDGAYQKVAEAKIETAYKELATKAPEAAEHIADKVEAVNPGLAAKMREHIQDAKEASTQEQVIVGHDAVKAEMEAAEAAEAVKRGETEEVMSARAHKGALASARVYSKASARSAVPRDTPASIAIAKQFKLETGHDISSAEVRQSGVALRNRMRKEGNIKHLDSPEIEKDLYTPEQTEMIRMWKMARQMPDEDIFTGAFGVDTFKNHPAWQAASYRIDNLLRGAINGEIKLTAHKILDEFLAQDLHPAIANVVQKLRNHVEDVEIAFADLLGKPNSALGEYHLAEHKIILDESLSLHPMKADYAANVVLHELVHAATARLIKGLKPEHPLMKELNSLLKEARNRAREMEIENPKVQHTEHYGLVDEFEFASEVFTSPSFQQFLIESDKFAAKGKMAAKTPSMVSRLADLFGKMLGITKPEELQLLSSAMLNISRIMEHQSLETKALMARSARPEAVVQRMSAGLAEASRDVLRATMGGDKKLHNVALGKLTEWQRQIRQTFAVHTMGPGAKVADALIAKGLAEVNHREAISNKNIAETNQRFWQKNVKNVWNWMEMYEKGAKFKDSAWKTITENYIARNLDVFMQDAKNGIHYEPVDHYMMHAFKPKDGQTVDQFLRQRYGAKWGDPAFIKDRSFEMYREAMAAGWKPKFNTPEEVMLAREHASNVAGMQVELLSQLENLGYAVKTKEAKIPPEGFGNVRRSPNETTYWVENNAYRVIHNAFDTKSLWNLNNIGGDIFRGAMALKNNLVPIRLMGLFHVTHVGLVLDNATAFGRLAKELAAPSTTKSTLAILSNLVEGFTPLVYSFVLNPRLGGGLMRAYTGSLKRELTGAEAQMLQYFNEAGFIPTMSKEWKATAIKSFKESLAQKSWKTIPKAPFALLQALQAPIFEVWIPALKTAVMSKEIATHLRANPELVSDPVARGVAFRRLQRAVDARYGEMNYGTLFWTKWVKDLLVANTLSIGWQKGVIDQFGGAPIEVMQAAVHGVKGQSPIERLRKGDLDRATYVMGYGVMAGGINGLISYSNTGQMPQGLDYILPRTGNQNLDGTAERLSTPFFTREFASIYKHIENKGLLRGVEATVTGKASGLVGMTKEAIIGQDSLGQQFRDPNGTPFQFIAQTVNHMMGDIAPISFKGADTDNLTSKKNISSFVGFTPAPKYMTDSPATSITKQLYGDFHTSKGTAYEKAQQSKLAKEYRELVRKDDPKAEDKLDEITQKYQLTGKQVRNLARSAEKGGSGLETMYKALSWQEQKKVLAKATSEERKKLLPMSKSQIKYSEEYAE